MISSARQIQIAADFPDDGPVDAPMSEGHAADESIVGNDVDRPRNAAGPLVYQFDGFAAEYARRFRAGRTNATRHVGGRFVDVEGFEQASKTDPLLQLAHARLLESCRQLRLS